MTNLVPWCILGTSACLFAASWRFHRSSIRFLEEAVVSLQQAKTLLSEAKLLAKIWQQHSISWTLESPAADLRGVNEYLEMEAEQKQKRHREDSGGLF